MAARAVRSAARSNSASLAPSELQLGRRPDGTEALITAENTPAGLSALRVCRAPSGPVQIAAGCRVLRRGAARRRLPGRAEPKQSV